MTNPTEPRETDASTDGSSSPSPAPGATEPARPNRPLLAFLLLLLAVLPATWGHLRLITGETVGWFGSAIAVVMVVVAVRLTGNRLTAWTPPERDPRPAARWPLLLTAAILGGIAWRFQLDERLGEPWVVIIWLTAIGLLLAPALLSFSPRKATESLGNVVRGRLPEILAVLLLLVVALAFRLPDLERYPASVHNDEASCGLMAQHVLDRWAAGDDVFFVPFTRFWNFPSMGFFPSAAAQALTGPGLYGHRLSNVVLGMVALLLLYLLIRSLAGVPPAVITLALAAVGHTAVHWSRSGIHSGHAAWLTVLCGWLLWKAVATGRFQYFVLLGCSAAACLLTYNAAFLLPVWVALVVAACWLANRRFRTGLSSGFAIAGLSALVFFAPMIAVYQNKPAAFFQRSSMMVWTNDPSSVQHMRSNWGDDYRRALIGHNWTRTARLLHGEGDANLQYGNRGIGAVDGITAVALILGLGVALGRWSRPIAWPLLFLLALNTLLGAVLVMDGVQYSRIAGAALVIMVLPALWAGELIAAAREAIGRRAHLAVVVALAIGVVVVGVVNWRYTFIRHDEHSWSGGGLRYGSVAGTIARNIRDWGGENFTLVHDSLPSDLSHQAYRLTAGDRKMAGFESVEQIDLAAADGFATVTFAVAPDAAELIAQLESRFPGGHRPSINVARYNPDDVALLYRITVGP